MEADLVFALGDDVADAGSEREHATAGVVAPVRRAADGQQVEVAVTAGRNEPADDACRCL